MIRRLVLATILTLSGSAQADTGYDLLRRCERGEDKDNIIGLLDSARCSAFLEGVWSGAISAGTIMHSGYVFCGSATQVGQMVLIYKDWAKRNPQ